MQPVWNACMKEPMPRKEICASALRPTGQEVNDRLLYGN